MLKFKKNSFFNHPMKYIYGCVGIALSIFAPSFATSSSLILANQARAIDGDTLEILSDAGSMRVRLQGIDAPELSQDYGDSARQSLVNCIAGRTVVVRGDKTDRYGRIVGVVYADGQECNLQQIHLGMAWHYKAYQDEQSAKERKSYANAEQQARHAKLGLWATCAIAPWDWRKGVRTCTAPVFPSPTIQPTTKTASTSPKASASFSPQSTQCQRYIKMTCKQFTSCTQARQALACGNQRLDGDKDGTPCESLCQ